VVKGGGTDPIGGRSLIEGSLELRRPLSRDLDLAIFADGGQVSRNSLTYPLDALSYGAGTGLRYRTPVGPIRIDLALPADRRHGDAAWQIHLGVGQAF
jgi:translocation and assembly module TamA